MLFSVPHVRTFYLLCSNKFYIIDKHIKRLFPQDRIYGISVEVMIAICMLLWGSDPKPQIILKENLHSMVSGAVQPLLPDALDVS